MTVTDIKARKKGISLLCTENGETELNTDTLLLAGIKKGDLITEEELSALIRSSETDRAKSRALWYLSRGDCTKKALVLKLCRTFGEDASQKAAERMEELGLIDDLRYARRLSENLAESNVSKREIKQKLFQKGVSKDIIDEVLENLATDPVSQIRELIVKKYQSKLSAEDGVKKVYAALIRKGFSYADVRTALMEYSENLTYSEE